MRRWVTLGAAGALLVAGGSAAWWKSTEDDRQREQVARNAYRWCVQQVDLDAPDSDAQLDACLRAYDGNR